MKKKDRALSLINNLQDKLNSGTIHNKHDITKSRIELTNTVEEPEIMFPKTKDLTIGDRIFLLKLSLI